VTDPPASLDAEESVLGACMISDRAVETCSDLLEGREFYGLKNGVIYRAILNLYSRGESVDGITVHDQLVRDGTLDKSGGVERVHELAALVPAAANVKHYAEIVRETWIARELVGLGHECIRLGHERPGKSEDLIAQADRKMLELQHLQERRRDTVFTGKQLAEIYLDKLHNPPDDSDGVKPPFSFLKRLQPSRLYVLGAYQKTGKTVLAGSS
jgi:replicative DNA helicase